MHRHGYTGRKLGRTRDERRRLVKNLATSLVLDESLKTTLPKAKELVPYAERLIAQARQGDLAHRRRVIAGLLRDDAAFKLVDEIAPQLAKRDSGWLRIKRAGWRKGDHAELATVSFVDELKRPDARSTQRAASGKKPATKATTKQPVTKKPAASQKPSTLKAKKP